MYLFILGFVFVVGLFIYYFLSTSSGSSKDEPPKIGRASCRERV